MTSTPEPVAAAGGFLAALEEVSEAVESGAGLPSVTRAASRALEASVIVLDSASSVLAVACASPEDERAVMAGESGTETVELQKGARVEGDILTRSFVIEPGVWFQGQCRMELTEADEARLRVEPGAENRRAEAPVLRSLTS